MEWHRVGVARCRAPLTAPQSIGSKETQLVTNAGNERDPSQAAAHSRPMPGAVRALPDFLKPNAPIDIPGSRVESNENPGAQRPAAANGDLIQCIKCANLIRSSATNCPICGSVLPTMPSPATAAPADPAESRGIRQGVIVLFAVFVFQLVAPVALVGIAAFLGGSPDTASTAGTLMAALFILYGVGWFFLGLVAPLVGWLPRWVLLSLIISPGVLAVVYLAIAYREINRLPTAYKIMGWVGCVGLALLWSISVVYLLGGHV